MKRIKEIIIAMITLVLCFSLSACGNKYVSHYSATLMVRTNTSNKATLSFGSFSGTYVMHLKSNGDDKAYIAYEAKLEEGNIKVYYDFDDDKLDLFEIESDGLANGKSETFSSNKNIYIVIESDGKCKEGSFSFVLEKSE